MNSIRNSLGMRETEIAREPSRLWNPHFYAIFAQVHNSLYTISGKFPPRLIKTLIGSEFPQSTWLRPFALPHSDPLRRVLEGSLRPSDIIASTNICLRKGPSAIVHIYPSVLQALAGRGYAGYLEG